MLCLLDVVTRVHEVFHLDGNLDDVQAHQDHMLRVAAKVSGLNVALKGVLHEAAKPKRCPSSWKEG
jgi:hypothetical protein